MSPANNVAISDFPFVQFGFVFAVIIPILLMLTFPITKRMSRAKAQKYLGALTWGYVALAVIDVIYAVASGQLQTLTEVFGWDTLVEFILFAAGFFLLMLFMASKAVAGMPEKPAPKGVAVKGTVVKDGKVVGVISEDNEMLLSDRETPSKDTQE